MCIIIPPDIDQDPNDETMQNLKEKHGELYSKRIMILKQYTPIYLYAIDAIGSSLFVESFCDSKMSGCHSDEDVWTTYFMTRSDTVVSQSKSIPYRIRRDSFGEPSVFSAEVSRVLIFLNLIYL